MKMNLKLFIKRFPVAICCDTFLNMFLEINIPNLKNIIVVLKITVQINNYFIQKSLIKKNTRNGKKEMNEFSFEENSREG